jgi:hypothetical protein
MRRSSLALLAVALLLGAIGAAVSRAASGPAYAIHATWGPTNLAPGDTKADTDEAQFVLRVQNIGNSAGAEDLVITDKLPGHVTATAVHWPDPQIQDKGCTGVGTGEVKCVLPAAMVPSEVPPAGPKLSTSNHFSPLPDGYLAPIFIDVSVPRNAEGVGPNLATVAGGGAAEMGTDEDQVSFESTPAPFGIVPGSFLADNYDAAYPDGVPDRVASDHPFELRVNFDLTAKTGVNDQSGGDGTRYVTSTGQIKTVEATLPRGMVVNPEATPKCDPVDFAEKGALNNSTACPPDTQVGYLTVFSDDGTSNYGGGGAVAISGSWVLANRVPLYNLKPPKGVPADIAFNAGGLVQGHIYGIPDAANNYAIKSITPNISSIVQARGAQVTLWGVPGDPAHNKFRWYPKAQEDGTVLGASWGSAPIRPFLTNPMDCGTENGATKISVDSYNAPGSFSPIVTAASPLNVTGCDDKRFRFEPDIAIQPSDRHAGAPTGLQVNLKVPQRNDEVTDAKELYAQNGSVKAIATPPIKKAVVTLPEGMTLSPSAAQGLGSCSPSQIGLGTNNPVECPQNSQYGTLVIHTPIFPVDAPLTGHVYIAEQVRNPFSSFLALYLVIEEPERGIVVKLPGRVDLDSQTGRITTTFDELPQFPVSDMELSLKGGVRAGLVEPSTCGQKTITAEFFSWQDPATSHTVKSSYEVTENPDGSPCVSSLAQRPFSPLFQAGTVNNVAGSYSPLDLRVTRSDDDQELSRLAATMAEGLTGRVAGLDRCSDASIARAISRAGAGEGSLEQAAPSCPTSSQIGTTEVGAGVGVPLTYVPGKVYLAGPYAGAPLSIIAITPAVVGPFDLGVIAVRTSVSVNPVTTRVTAASDPFPQIYQGIPVRIRDIRVNLDRKGVVLNPTGCAVKQINAQITGTGGDLFSPTDDSSVDLRQRFQAAECASLRFHPQLSLRLSGATGRGGHPRLRAVYAPKRGDANAAAVSVALPHSEFLDQAHIRTVCTRVQFAARSCPAGSVYGHVSARSPLFDETLSGPIYLRSSNHPLPDLVAVLEGPASLPVRVEVAGRVDSINGGIRNSFEFVPDAPVTQAVFNFAGGKKGLLVNSTDLCARAHRVTAKLAAQNGRKLTLRPLLKARCRNAPSGSGKASSHTYKPR